MKERSLIDYVKGGGGGGGGGGGEERGKNREQSDVSILALQIKKRND